MAEDSRVVADKARPSGFPERHMAANWNHFLARVLADGTEVTWGQILGPVGGGGHAAALQIPLHTELCSRLTASRGDLPCGLLRTEAQRVVCICLRLPPLENPHGPLKLHG